MRMRHLAKSLKVSDDSSVETTTVTDNEYPAGWAELSGSWAGDENLVAPSRLPPRPFQPFDLE